MFELSWAELMLVAVLALLIIGPKDLPLLFRNLGKVVGQGQRLWRKLLLSMQQLEREVSQSSATTSNEDWQQWLPEQLRHLPADYLPGSMTAEQHAERQAEQQRYLEQARQQSHVEQSAAAPSLQHTKPQTITHSPAQNSAASAQPRRSLP